MVGLNEHSLILLELVNYRMNNNKEQFYGKLYEAITNLLKQDLIKIKPLEVCSVINELILYYSQREEYEKCHKLNLTGYDIFNTIID